MPDYYPLIRAARYLGIDPIRLSTISIGWRNAGLLAEGAEVEARAEEQKKAAKAKRRNARSQRPKRRHRR